MDRRTSLERTAVGLTAATSLGTLTTRAAGAGPRPGAAGIGMCDWLQVYYDVGNSTGNGYDVPGELRTIGNDRLCAARLKDWNTPQLGSEDASVDMAGAAAALRDIRYEKWLVLETSGREGHFMEDARAT